MNGWLLVALVRHWPPLAGDVCRLCAMLTLCVPPRHTATQGGTSSAHLCQILLSPKHTFSFLTSAHTSRPAYTASHSEWPHGFQTQLYNLDPVCFMCACVCVCFCNILRSNLYSLFYTLIVYFFEVFVWIFLCFDSMCVQCTSWILPVCTWFYNFCLHNSRIVCLCFVDSNCAHVLFV